MAFSRIVIATLLFVVGVTCGPIEVEEPATDLVPPAESASDFYNDVPTPATDLLPPEINSGPTLASELLPPPENEPREKMVPATLFLINVYALKSNRTDELNDVLHDDVMEEVPEEITEPLALFLLVVQEMDENHPVSLDEVAKDLEEEGFAIEKIERDGETRIVKVNLSSVETTIKELEMRNDESKVPAASSGNAIERGDKQTEDDGKLDASGKLTKIRRKRTICLRCKLDELKAYKHHGGGYGGGCGGGCGGGGYYQPPIYQPVQVIPVQVRPQPIYQPPPQPCNTCGGYGHGGYGNYGNGNSYSQASAQASASASSYGK